MDWPTFVAIAALGLGILNFVRSIRGTPRPKLRTRSTIDPIPEQTLNEHGDPVDWQPLVLHVTNRGSGIAYDVRVRVVGVQDQNERELGALQLDETGKASFNYAAESFPYPGTFEMSWEQHPSKKRLTRIVDYGDEHTDLAYVP